MKLFQSADSSIKNIQNCCTTENESEEGLDLNNQLDSEEANDQIYDSLQNSEERSTKQTVFDFYLLKI